MNLSTYLFSSAFALVSMAATVNGCGMFEFFYWNQLPEKVMKAAMNLGYDKNSWSNIDLNPIEHIAFKNLKDAVTTMNVAGEFVPPADGTVMESIKHLGLFDDNGVCWDFYINHYDGYTWDELGEATTPFGENVQDLVKIIGWDQTMWDDTTYEGPIPEAECKFWITLSPVEKYAYHSLGWNRVSFSNAPCDPRCPRSLACPFNDE
jgi:hypothetical protein